MEAKQKTQKLYHDRHAKACAFNEGDPVFVRNTGSGSTWLSGNITKIRGPVSYTVKLNDGRLMRKHVDQIRFRTATVNEPTEDTLDDCLPPSSSTSSNNNPQNTSAETAPPVLHHIDQPEFDTLSDDMLINISRNLKAKRGGNVIM